MKTTIPDPRFRTQIIELPSPGPGTSREIVAFRYGDPESRPKVYIQTALHADEIPGTLVIHHLRQYLNQAAIRGEINGEIIIVPVANPIGMAQRVQGNLAGRLDLNDGKNYNRHYPDLVPGVVNMVEEKLTNDESKNDSLIRDALKQTIGELPEASESDAFRKHLLALSADSDYCLDLHCDSESILYMYSSGTHPKIADELSSQMGCLAHLVDDTTSFCFDGTVSLTWVALANHFPDFPIPYGCMGSTIELRGSSDVSDEFAKNDAENLFQFLVNQGVVSGQKKPAPKTKCKATPLLGQIYVKAPSSGILVYKKECGDRVSKGEVVAELVDPIKQPEDSRIELKSDIDGILFSRTTQRMVGPGQIVIGIAGDEIIPGRKGENLLSD